MFLTHPRTEYPTDEKAHLDSLDRNSPRETISCAYGELEHKQKYHSFASGIPPNTLLKTMVEIDSLLTPDHTEFQIYTYKGYLNATGWGTDDPNSFLEANFIEFPPGVFPKDKKFLVSQSPHSRNVPYCNVGDQFQMYLQHQVSALFYLGDAQDFYWPVDGNEMVFPYYPTSRITYRSVPIPLRGEGKATALFRVSLLETYENLQTTPSYTKYTIKIERLRYRPGGWKEYALDVEHMMDIFAIHNWPRTVVSEEWLKILKSPQMILDTFREDLFRNEQPIAVHCSSGSLRSFGFLFALVRHFGKLLKLVPENLQERLKKSLLSENPEIAIKMLEAKISQILCSQRQTMGYFDNTAFIRYYLSNTKFNL